MSVQCTTTLEAERMRKRLVRHGNSRAIVIDKTLMELVGLDEDGEVQLTVEGDSLVIVPVRKPDSREAKFERALHESLEKYADVYRRLAE